MKPLILHRAAVLGAGVMGAQIAAHLANAGVPVLLYDLADPGPDPSAVAARAIAGLPRMQPPPLTLPGHIEGLTPANYDNDLPLLAGCDLVIEAIAERAEWKHQLFARIAPHLAPDAILATNTSGLSLAELAAPLAPELAARFCGLHFFNPPRYMPLVELIPGPATPPALLDQLETWLTRRLGKQVVRAKDTPNFVANRVGVFSLLNTIHHGERFGLGPEEVDALTGPLLGRARSATFRTIDVVGLDTLAHVVRTLHDQLPNDPWHHQYRLPEWLNGLLAAGRLGQKRGAGVFKKQGRDILVFDAASGSDRPANREIHPEVAALLAERDPAARLAGLRASSQPQAQFLWACLRDLFHYCAVHLADIAHSARDVDQALCWGFGWSQGPFELWQAAGWSRWAEAVAADIAAGQSSSPMPLPAWALDPERSGVHGAGGSWAPQLGRDLPRSPLPVYARQLFPPRLLGEPVNDPAAAGETLFETPAVRLWRLPERDAGIGILSLKTKAHALNRAALAGIRQAIDHAEAELDGLVLWQPAPFAVGADLAEFATLTAAGDPAALEAAVADFQLTGQRIKFAQVPVVAGVSGLALGGGCEFAMLARRRVLALDSQLGLVEAGVGLIPAGGGCKEMALLAAERAAQSFNPEDLLNPLQPLFQRISRGRPGNNAHEARVHGFARADDPVLFNTAEVLQVALGEARTLADAGHLPPLPRTRVPVAGRTAIATLEMQLVNQLEGGMISAHDYRVARATAVALCGGEIEGGSLVDEDWLLAVERRLFVELLQTPETQARIRHMLDTGKPLRN